jgi:hypothetical protein
MNTPEELLGFALTLTKRYGCEAFPVADKKPVDGFAWSQYRLGAPGIHPVAMRLWNKGTGYALAPVKGSRLAFLDVDDSAFSALLLTKIPNLINAPSHQRADHVHYVLFLPAPMDQAQISLPDPSGGEIASLRGHGAYVVGPYSYHESGESYHPVRGKDGSNIPLELTDGEYTILIEMLQAGKTSKKHSTEKADASYNPNISRPLVQAVIDTLQQAGYIRRDDKSRGVIWLNGQCPNEKAHKHGDESHSFGFNSKGVGYCFVCGSMTTVEVARYLGVSIKREQPAAPQRERRAELISDGFTKGLRLYDLLRHAGKSGRAGEKAITIFSTREILSTGSNQGWSRSKTYRHLASACDAGLISQCDQGYQLTEKLPDQSPATPGKNAFKAHPANYRKSWAEKVEEKLQPKMSAQSFAPTETIAWYVGVSASTLYRYESDLGITRLESWRREPLSKVECPDGIERTIVPTQETTFGGRRTGYKRLIVVNGKETRRVRLEDFTTTSEALDMAHKIAARIGGSIWIESQRPSLRVLPGQDPASVIPHAAEYDKVRGAINFNPSWFGLGNAVQRPLPEPRPKTTQTQGLKPHNPVNPSKGETTLKKLDFTGVIGRSDKRIPEMRSKFEHSQT